MHWLAIGLEREEHEHKTCGWALVWEWTRNMTDVRQFRLLTGGQLLITRSFQ